jgi:hypothetical protein
MHPNLDTHPSESLDILTLAAVKDEVERRAAECRQTWRLFPNGAGLVQAQTLDLLTRWLDAQIAIAAAALEAHSMLTEAGRAALAATEKGVAA